MAKAQPGPRDFSQRAVAVIDHLIETYDEPEDGAPDPTPEPPQAKAGRKGGKARAAALTAEQRSASARRAAKARWAKHPA